jgi:hypothetical protein
MRKNVIYLLILLITLAVSCGWVSMMHSSSKTNEESKIYESIIRYALNENTGWPSLQTGRPVFLSVVGKDADSHFLLRLEKITPSLHRLDESNLAPPGSTTGGIRLRRTGELGIRLILDEVHWESEIMVMVPIGTDDCTVNGREYPNYGCTLEKIGGRWNVRHVE